SENCNLTGLLIEDAEAGEHTVAGAEPIRREALVELVRCRRVNVSGVQILDGTPNGMLLQDCRDTTITGCTITDDREPKQMEHAIVWTGTGHGGLVAHSRIGRGTRGDVKLPAEVTVDGIVGDGVKS
ncbi:MAG TPA: hypothetical protein DCE43_04855, partial [Planctomycetaceae bacterium]|nr:hypothetical protein [Planctomycetaceae bacterium]